MLSTNPIAVVDPVSNVGRRVEAKNRNRIGNRVDPYRILVVCSLFPSINRPNQSCVVLYCKNNVRNCII